MIPEADIAGLALAYHAALTAAEKAENDADIDLSIDLATDCLVELIDRPARTVKEVTAKLCVAAASLAVPCAGEPAYDLLQSALIDLRAIGAVSQ